MQKKWACQYTWASWLERNAFTDMSNTFGNFLLAEMNKRNMSAREFSRFIGVSHATINKFLDYGVKDVGDPSVEFLFKLAEATNTHIGTVMALLRPGIEPIDPEALALAQQLQQLPESERKTVYKMLRGVLIED